LATAARVVATRLAAVQAADFIRLAIVTGSV
jgi:hypothetical protein